MQISTAVIPLLPAGLAQRILSTDLLVVSYFSLRISRTVFISSLFLNIFDKFWFLNWCVFPLIKVFSGLCCFWSEVCCHSYLYTFVGKVSFISASTYDFIFIAGLSSLIMICCSVLWCGFLHGFCPPVSLNFFRYVCVWVSSFYQIWKFFSHYFFRFSFCPSLSSALMTQITHIFEFVPLVATLFISGQSFFLFHFG